MFMIPVTTLGQ